MPIFEIEHPTTKQIIEVEAPSFPAPAQLQQILASVDGGFKAQGKVGSSLPVGETIMRNYVRPALETGGLVAGGIIGGAAGTGMAPGVGTAALGLAGSGLGYAMGKNVADFAEESLGYKQPAASLKERALQTGSDVLEGASFEAGGQIAGRAIGAVANKAIAPFSKRLTSVDPISGQRVIKPEVKELKELYAKYGQDPLPSEILSGAGAGSRTLGMVESVLGYAPLSGDVMLKRSAQRLDFMTGLREKMIARGGTPRELEKVGRTIKKEAMDILERYAGIKGTKLEKAANDFLSRMGSDLGRYESGVALKDLLKDKMQVQKATVKGLYDKAAKLLGGEQARVPVSQETTAIADQLFNKEMSIPPAHRDKAILEKLRPFISESSLAGISKADQIDLRKLNPKYMPQIQGSMREANAIPWEAAQSVRSRMLDRIGQIYRETGGMGNSESRVYSILADAIDKDMARVAQQRGGNAWKAYSAAREAAKKQHELFNKDVLRIMNANPEQIINRVTKNGEVTLLKQIKSAAGDDALEPIKRTYFRQIIDESVDKNGQINAGKIQTKLKRLTQDTFNELTSPQQQEVIRGLLKNINDVNKKYGGMKTMEFLDIVANEPPSRVVNYLVKPENLSHIKLARRLLGKAQMREVEQQTLLKVLKTSATGNYMPVSSAKEFKKYKTVLSEMMEPKNFKALQDFVNMGTNADKVEKLAMNASQTGQVFVGWETARTIGKKLAAKKIAGVGGTLGIPWVLARIYTSKTASRYLTSALSLPPESKQAIELFTKAVIVSQAEN